MLQEDIQQLRPIRHTRISDEIVVQLTNLILSGAVGEGEKLSSERELAKRLSVNRTSLREALRRLESMGLVQVQPGNGIVVLDPDVHAGLEFVKFLLSNGIGLDRELILSLAEIRTVFAVPLIEMAAINADPEDIDRMQTIVDQYPREASSERLTGEHDFIFFQAMAKASGNKVFLYLLNTVREVFEKLSGVFYQTESSPAIAARLYGNIVEAIRWGDGKKAVALFLKQAKKDDKALLEMMGE